MYPIASRLIAALISVAPISAATESAARKPNIVLIFADDLGWHDVGYNDNSGFIETPHIDKLARDGMVFTNAYASMGNCAPSRACLLSGNYTPRHDVYAVGKTDRGRKNLMRLVPVPNTVGLTKEHVTFADELKAAGYATGIFGKWHFAASPVDLGFDVAPKPPLPGWHPKLTNNNGKEDPKLATNNALELYHLAEDIGEHKNLANANTAKRDELLGDLLAWFKSTDAKLPTKPNPQYDPNMEFLPKPVRKGGHAKRGGHKVEVPAKTE